MYNQIPVEDLSPNQMRNLISGRGVRVKHSAQGKYHKRLGQYKF